ncbi:hypothetical protein [Rhodococcus sp. H29-C3]|uniref:hypothetical protein n=1 Tax=Rhodococcus sp. H29-C3 TaxID=3046307 RepID=UPI0024BA769D|nr:hypothetical protein [Rhodococcus sp. H29-C3]MDJ0359115.1 hypothetical protein [Rhodococcus sp. H29-C3]
MMDNATVCWVAGFATVAIVVLIGAGPAGPGDSVSFSSGGVEWSKKLPDSLFEENIRWVPGDRRSTEFHVSNETGDDGRLVLWVESEDVGFEKTVSVSVEGRDNWANCAQVVVPAGADMLIGMSIVMADEARNDTQKSTADIDLVVQWDIDVDEMCTSAMGRDSLGEHEGS